MGIWICGQWAAGDASVEHGHLEQSQRVAALRTNTRHGLHSRYARQVLITNNDPCFRGEVNSFYTTFLTKYKGQICIPCHYSV